MNKIKISFDFDKTLGSNKEVQSFCAELYEDNNVEVWIHTRRHRFLQPINGFDESKEVYQIAEKYGIDKSNIVFTERNFKYPFLKKNGIDIHLDDDLEEFVYVPFGETNIIMNIYTKDWINIVKTHINKLKNEKSIST